MRIPIHLRPALSVALTLLVAAAGCSAAEERPATPSPAQAIVTTPASTEARASIADIAEASVASVVNISSEKVVSDPLGPFFDDPFFRHFFGEEVFPPRVPRERRERSLGSGVIVSAEGIVVTNSHVVENAESVRVALADGRELQAELAGADPRTDLAVLRLHDAGALDPLPFGDSDRLRLGDTVLAIGNPFGVGQTVTMGIVSAKGRADIGIVDYEDFIQTDAAINPGNSGGALINAQGELVGINTAIITRSGGYQGIGFAIPSNMARAVMQSLLEEGRVVRGWLGVVIQELTTDLAEALELDTSTGALVADVVGRSPADRAGVRRGDVITHLDGEPIESTAQLRNRVAGAGTGTEVKLDLIRDGRPRALEIELGELPEERVARELPDEPDVGRGPAGLDLAPLDRSLRERLGLRGDVHGLMVIDIEPGSPASRADLRVGDVIREVDSEPVTSLARFRRALAGAGDVALLLVQRGSSVLFVPLRPDREK